jgi:hypothetical protein
LFGKERKAGNRGGRDIVMAGFRDFSKRIEDLMIAVTFAEAGDDETARKFLERKKDRLKKFKRAPVSRKRRRARMEARGPSDRY